MYISNKEVSKKLKKISIPLLKSNLKMNIQSKYKSKGWRITIAKKLDMNIHTFTSTINPAHISPITVEKLMYIVYRLELDIEKVLETGEVVKSNQGRYGKSGDKIKWTDEVKRDFVKEYTNLNNSKSVIAEKYGLTIRSASTCCTNFKKKMKKEL